jgi:hypothetical protein
LPDATEWHALCLDWRGRLLEQGDLTSQLLRFVAARH